MERHGAVCCGGGHAPLQQRSMLGRAGSSSPESSGSTVLSTKGDSGAGGGGGCRTVPQHLPDHDGIGQNRIDAVSETRGQSIDVGGVGGSANATASMLPSNCRATAPNSRAMS